MWPPDYWLYVFCANVEFSVSGVNYATVHAMYIMCLLSVYTNITQSHLPFAQTLEPFGNSTLMSYLKMSEFGLANLLNFRKKFSSDRISSVRTFSSPMALKLGLKQCSTISARSSLVLFISFYADGKLWIRLCIDRYASSI